jgi:hypothetical protein
MLFDEDLITRNLNDMQQEVKDLCAESECLRAVYDSDLEKVVELRRESVEARPANPDLAEMLWQEAENLQLEGKEKLRLSVEKRLLAAEIQHRIEIRKQIECLDDHKEVWKKAMSTHRKDVQDF